MSRALCLTLLVAALVASPWAVAQVPAFSQQGLDGWTHKRFEGETRYSLVEIDGQTVVDARCDASASGLYLERDFDLATTPRLRWRWRVLSGVQPGIDLGEKSGDDALARVYAVTKTGLFAWQARALNYVWAHNDSAGSDWPSPYTAKNHQIAMGLGEPSDDGWVMHTVNLAEDFQRYFDIAPKRIVAIAIMSDCDNSASEAHVQFGDVELLPPTPQP